MTLSVATDGGYGLMNIGTHLVNNILHFAGHCRSVSATATTAGRPITPHDVLPSPSGMGFIAGENISATLTFAGGVTATLLLERFPEVDSTAVMLELLCTEGRLFWKEPPDDSTPSAFILDHPHFVPSDGTDGSAVGAWQVLPDPAPSAQPQRISIPADNQDFGFADEFVNALDEGRSHVCSGEEATHVMEILMGVLESAAYSAPLGSLPRSQALSAECLTACVVVGQGGRWRCRRRSARTRCCAGGLSTAWRRRTPTQCRARTMTGWRLRTAASTHRQGACDDDRANACQGSVFIAFHARGPGE